MVFLAWKPLNKNEGISGAGICALFRRGDFEVWKTGGVIAA